MSVASRRRILPLFVSGSPCPERCLYCDQATQTGQRAILGTEDVERAVAAAGPRGEVAFYGGTFTGLPRAEQERLLSPVRAALTGGRLAASRVSTHPRWCDRTRLGLLRGFGVSLVEVGVQSLDDTVLARCRRGVDAAGTLAALAAVRAEGLDLGVQTMPGLPGATRDSDRETARRLTAYEPRLARIYPTVVLRGTGLEALWRTGAYAPLRREEAIARAADQLDAFAEAGVRVQRIGLHQDAPLRAAMVAGPQDPSFGERVRAESAYRDLARRAGRVLEGRTLRVEIPARLRSQYQGVAKENLARFAREFPTIRLELVPLA